MFLKLSKSDYVCGGAAFVNKYIAWNENEKQADCHFAVNYLQILFFRFTRSFVCKLVSDYETQFRSCYRDNIVNPKWFKFYECVFGKGITNYLCVLGRILLFYLWSGHYDMKVNGQGESKIL